jgi:hypothetical protein
MDGRGDYILQDTCQGGIECPFLLFIGAKIILLQNCTVNPALWRSTLKTHHIGLRYEPLSPGVYLAKNPSACAVPFHILEKQFEAMHFKDALREFIVNQLQSTF